jgi:hypothetical protein
MARRERGWEVAGASARAAEMSSRTSMRRRSDGAKVAQVVLVFAPHSADPVSQACGGAE